MFLTWQYAATSSCSEPSECALLLEGLSGTKRDVPSASFCNSNICSQRQRTILPFLHVCVLLKPRHMKLARGEAMLERLLRH